MGRQVLIAEARAGRPSDFDAPKSASTSHDHQAECPFCFGHEFRTLKSLLDVTDQQGQWQVRVVPNKFPAVTLAQHALTQRGISALGQFPQRPDGAHEVIIESPRHVQDITELSRAELSRIVLVYRDRLRYWATDERIGQVNLFKNVGSAAGASLEHIHSQLVALPEIPPVMAAELLGSQEFYTANQACIFCDLVDEELKNRQRLIVAEGPFVAFCAYAGRQPYETWILPRKHCASFENLNESDAESLAEILRQVVQRLQTQLTSLSYNLVLHTAPMAANCADYYHWHFELVPRSAQLAGFEWGTGMYINPIAPEQAAERLRNGGR